MISKDYKERIKDKIKDLQLDINLLLETKFEKDNFNLLHQAQFELAKLLITISELDTQ